MKTLRITLASALMPLLCVSALSGYAEDVDMDDVAMDVNSVADIAGERPVRIKARDIIRDYMLENGDITQEELDARQEERLATREEIKALKEAGDDEALEAKREELRALRSERREELRAYIDENDDLKTALDEARANNREARQQIRDRMRERRQQFREQRETTEG